MRRPTNLDYTVRRWALPVLGSLTTFALLSGCVRVKPYEREEHARKTMQDRDPTNTKLEGHVHEYREGSIGGSGVGGGGCGCN
jgi:hypothetical protein